MALESASYISGLVAANPSGTDAISLGDDHLRLIKSVLKTSLPDVDQEAATIITKASAPTTQVRGTIWYDSGNDLLKINTATTGSTPSWATVNDAAPWASATAVAGLNAFRYTLGDGTLALADATLTTFPFASLNGGYDVDSGANFNTGTYTFTVPTTGKYYFHMGVRPIAADSPYENFDFYIYKNSAAYATSTVYRQAGGDYAVSTSTYSLSCVMDAAATDTVLCKIMMEANSSWSPQDWGTNSWFEGFRLL